MVDFSNFGKMAKDAAGSFTGGNNNNNNENKDGQNQEHSNKSWTDIGNEAKDVYATSKTPEGLDTNRAGQVAKDAMNKYNTAPNKDPAAFGKDTFQSFLGGSKAKGEGAIDEPQQKMGSNNLEPNEE